MQKIVMGLMIAAMMAMVLWSCTDAEVVSTNLSKAADQFEVFRRVVFYNGITNEYILTIEGYCSLQGGGGTSNPNELQVIVKTGPHTYLKHFLGLSDNVTYFAEQLEGMDASTAHYRVIFKPSVIIPNIDLE